MVTLLTNLIIFFTGKEGKEMMAKLWAIEVMKQKTVEEARMVYERVPRLLKNKVKEILIDSGMEELTVAEA